MHRSDTAGPRSRYVELVLVLLLGDRHVMLNRVCLLCGDAVELHNAFIIAILNQVQTASATADKTGDDDKATVLKEGDEGFKPKAVMKEEAQSSAIELLPSVKKGWNHASGCIIHNDRSFTNHSLTESTSTCRSGSS